MTDPLFHVSLILGQHGASYVQHVEELERIVAQVTAEKDALKAENDRLKAQLAPAALAEEGSHG